MDWAQDKSRLGVLMKCQQCGQQNEDDAVFCMMCCAYLRLAQRVAASVPMASPSSVVLHPSSASADTIKTAPSPKSTRPGDAALRSNSHTDGEPDFAGFGKRAAAYLWDLAVTFLIFMAVYSVGAGVHLLIAPRSSPSNTASLLAIVTYCLVYYLYHAISESSQRQATFGKTSRRIKVTDLQGGRISFARATSRHFAKFLSLLPFGLGFFIAGFHARKQGLHDILSGCVVVNREEEATKPARNGLAPDAQSKVTTSVNKHGTLLLLLGILAVVVYVFFDALVMESRVKEVVTHGARARLAVTNFYLEQGRFPVSLAEIGMAETAPHIKRATVEPQTNALRIEVAIPSLQGSYFRFVPDASAENLQWRCDLGDMPPELTETICRGLPSGK